METSSESTAPVGGTAETPESSISSTPLTDSIASLSVETTNFSSLKRGLPCESSPRKSKRMRLSTPKGQELESQRSLSLPSTAPRSIILTPSQAMAKNKKLPKGYRLVPASMLCKRGSDIATIVNETRRPQVTRHSTNGVNTTPAARKRRGGKTTDDIAHEQKLTRIALLKKRLELLKARQAMVSPLPSMVPSPLPVSTQLKKTKKTGRTPRTPAAFPSHSTNPPPPSRPTTPMASPQQYSRGHTPTYFSSAPLTPGEGKSRSGRVVKAPKFLTADDSAPVKLTEPLRHCRNLLNTVMQQKFSHHFGEPVDPVKLNIPDYFNVIKNPMDLGTVKAQLNRGFYADIDAFARDVRLVWSNAILYNPQGSFFHVKASEYSSLFEKKFGKIPRHATPKAATVKTPRPRSVSSTKKTPASKTQVLKEVEGLKDTIGNLQTIIMNMSKKNIATPGPSAAARRKQSLDQTPLTIKEKQELKNNIFQLPAQKLQPVVEMCSRNSGSTDQNDEEIEIDIDKLDIPTLRELQRYVKRTLANQNRKKRTGRKTPTPSRSPAPSPQKGHMPSPSPAMRAPSPSMAVGNIPPLEGLPNPGFAPSSAPPLSQPSDFPAPSPPQPAHPVASAPVPSPKSDSSSDSESGSSDSESDSDSDNEKKVSAAPVQQPLAPPPPQFCSPPPSSFGDASMYATAPTMGSAQAQTSAVGTGLDTYKGPTHSAAWSSLGDAPAARQDSTSGRQGDGLWSSFQSKQQEKQGKELERQQLDARMAAERERENEELRRKAREHEEAAERLRREQEEAGLERDRQQQREREAARRERDAAATVDLGEQSMMMDMMDGSFG